MRKMGPKPTDHPSIGTLCRICNKPFQTGDYTTLIAEANEDKVRQVGRPHNAIAVEIHWECVPGRMTLP